MLAFKDFKFKLGIFGSPWAGDYGFYWFLKMFRDPDFLHVLWNTMSISFVKIMISTVSCILFALLLNEVRCVIIKGRYSR